MPRAELLSTLFLLGACSQSSVPGPDAAPVLPDAPADAATGLPTLVINEVAAAGDPDDWIEVKNVGPAAIELGNFAFIDSGDVIDAAPLDDLTLAPGAYHVQVASDATSGFKLASDEEVHLVRSADGVEVDAVDWAEGESPELGSYARIPDGTGAFQAVAAHTQGATND